MASRTLASLIVRIGADVTGVTAGLNTLDRRVRKTKKQFSTVTDSTLRWQSALGVLAGAAGMGIALKKTFELGAGIEETASKARTVLGPALKDAQQFLDDFANTAGLTNTQGLELVATTAAIAQGMGFGQKASAEFSKDVVTLAGDLTSFNDVPIEETSRAIQSALTGERESLKRLGIVILETDVQKRALTMTSKKTAGALTQQEKATATLALITERAGVAVGDLARTMDSPANRARKITAEFLDLRDSIATGLLPALTVVLDELDGATGGFDSLGDAITGNSAKIAAWARFVVASFKTVAKAIAAPIRIAFNLGEVLGKVLTASVQAMRGNFKGARETLGSMIGDFGDMRDSVSDVIDGFDEMRVASGEAWQTLADGATQADVLTSSLQDTAQAMREYQTAAKEASESNALTVTGRSRLQDQFHAQDLWREFFAGQNRDPSAINMPDVTPQAKAAMDGVVDVHGDAMNELIFQVENYADRFRDAVFDAAASGELSMQDLVRVFTTGFAAILKDAQKTGDRTAELLGAGLAGASIGGSSGSPLTGALGGAAAGFAIAGPVGALAGGVTGLVSGLFSQAKRAREAARIAAEAAAAEKRALFNRRQSFEEGLKGRESALAGETFALLNQREQQLNAARRLVNQGEITEDMYLRLARVLDEEMARAIEEIGRAAEEATRAMQEATRAMREDFEGRALDLFGPKGEAGKFRLNARQRQERLDAAGQSADTRALVDLVHQGERAQLAFEAQAQTVRDAASEQIAAIDRQTDVAHEQLSKAEDTLRAQERSVEITRRVVESLTAFSGGLALGPLSPLSPAAQLAEARSQFGGLSELALGGDVTAAQSLPAAGRALLEASRAFNASGVDFVQDFDRVKGIVEAVTAQFGAQLSTEERILAQLQTQTSSLRDQVSQLAAQRQAIAANATAQIAALNAAHAQEMNLLSSQLYALTQVTDAIEESTIKQDIITETLRIGFDGLAERLHSLEESTGEGQERVRRAVVDLEPDFVDFGP